MKSCPQKKYKFPQKNWISLLNSAGIKQKSSVNPTYGNLYHYAANNPVRYIDPDGRKAGDKFNTMDEAAKDFSDNYNDDSIRKNLEYGTTIYQDKNGKYYYSIPNQGSQDGCITYTNPINKKDKEVARAHTHGAYDSRYLNNQFSNIKKKDKKGNIVRSGDIPNADRRKKPVYVGTPNGSFRRYDPKTGKDKLLSTDLPSDPNDPDRLNKNNARSGKVDEFIKHYYPE